MYLCQEHELVLQCATATLHLRAFGAFDSLSVTQIILIPSLVGQSCLLLNSSLSQFEASQCGLITTRSYDTFGRRLSGVTLTGANTLDVGKISVDAGLLTNNPDVWWDAYRRVHDELSIRNEVKADGIRADGSFGK